MQYHPFPANNSCPYPPAIALLLALLFALPSFAQDTLYFTQCYEPALDPAKAYFYEIRHFDTTDAKRSIVMGFYADSNKLVFVKRYSDYPELVYDGKCTDWYRNGKVCREARYKNGVLQGDESVYYPNGQLNRKIRWDHDTIVSGVFFNEDGSPKTEVFKEDLDYDLPGIAEKPSFPGGEGAMMRFLAENLTYPLQAVENNIQGTVYVSFIVEANGEILRAVVLSRPNHLLDPEALRVVKAMPRWNPGAVNGLPVRVRYTLPIRFKLE